MMPFEIVGWILGIALLSWVKAHKMFDKTGNDRGRDYDSYVLALVSLVFLVYVLTLHLRA